MKSSIKLYSAMSAHDSPLAKINVVRLKREDEKQKFTIIQYCQHIEHH